MKKIFTLVVAAFAAFCANAETIVYDTLTVESLGIDLVKGSYDVYTSQFASGAEYYAYAMRNPQVVETTLEDGTVKKDTVGYNIQLRGNKKVPYSGIAVTKSAGKLREVKFVWAANTTASRDVDVYAADAACENADWMTPDSREGLVLVATDGIAYDENKELVNAGGEMQTVEGDVEYFGICMHATTAAYFTKIIIGWGIEDVVGIQKVEAAQSEKAYNLNGQAVKSIAAPGIYVKGGKLMMSK